GTADRRRAWKSLCDRARREIVRFGTRRAMSVRQSQRPGADMRYRWLLVSLLCAGTTVPVAGQQPLDERVLPREVADEVLRLWNAPGTLRVEGPYTVEAAREVSGDIAVLGGELVVSGRVLGRIVAVNASVRLTSGA